MKTNTVKANTVKANTAEMEEMNTQPRRPRSFNAETDGAGTTKQDLGKALVEEEETPELGVRDSGKYMGAEPRTLQATLRCISGGLLCGKKKNMRVGKR